MAEIKDYDVDANNNTATPPDGAAEGWAPSTVNNTIRELMARTKRLWEDTSAVNTTTGTSNAYLLSASQTISAYAAGDVFMFVADRANTGAATLAVDGLAAKSLKTVTQAELVADQLTANGIYVAAYDATNDVFQVLGVDESSGTMTLDSLSVDTISEKTAAAGVTIDGVLLKDNAVSATAASTVTVADASNEALTITQSGNGGGVLIDDTGTGVALTVTNPTAQAAGTPVIVVGSPSAAAKADTPTDNILVEGGRYGFAHVQHSTSNAGGPGLVTLRSRGTAGAETVVDNADLLGLFRVRGYDGTSYTQAGYIAFSVDETNRSIATGNIPTKFELVLNDGTTNTTPITCIPSSSAGYARTTLDGNLTVNGPTGGHAATFNCGDAVYSGLIAWMQNDTGYARLGHSNTYTFYGEAGQLRNKSADNTSGTYGIRILNSTGTTLLYTLSNGEFCTGGAAQSPYSYTTASAANVFVTSGGILQRSTSSARFKTNVQPIEDEWADKILDLEPVFYKSTAPGDTSNPDWTYYGLIAEDVAQVDGRYVHFDTGYKPRDPANKDEDGNPDPIPATPRKPQNEWVADGVQYERMVVPLISVVKRQRARIEALEAQVSELTAQMSALADRVAALEA